MRAQMPRLSDLLLPLLELLNEQSGAHGRHMNLNLPNIATTLGCSQEDVRAALEALDMRGLLETQFHLGGGATARVRPEGRLLAERNHIAGSERLSAEDPNNDSQPDARKVFMIQGRNQAAADQVRAFLRATGLREWTFAEVARELGNDASIYDIVGHGVSKTRAVIALFTPDEVASLDSRLRRLEDKGRDAMRRQSRPNVIYEAGLARGLNREGTILVSFGNVELPSDLDGVLILRLRNDPSVRNDFRERLRAAGCAIDDGVAWMSEREGGDFDPRLVETQPLDSAESGTVTRSDVIEQAFRDASRFFPGMTKERLEELLAPGPRRDSWFAIGEIAANGELLLPDPEGRPDVSFAIPRGYLEDAREKLERKRKYDAKHPLDE